MRSDSRFWDDVQFCALNIYLDLSGGRRGRWRFRELLLLCERSGGLPLVDWDLSPRQAAQCMDGSIILSGRCSSAEYREAIPHELVHRLADTERWAPLNHHIHGWRYDRRRFVETVAKVVGLLFRHNPGECN